MIIQRTESVNSADIRRLDLCDICDDTFPMELTAPVKHICPKCKESLQRMIKIEQTKEFVVPKDAVSEYVKTVFPNFPMSERTDDEI